MESVVLFGCGRYYKNKEKQLLQKFNVVRVIDNSRAGEYIEIANKSILIETPKKYARHMQNEKIIIAAEAFIEMSQQLLKLGIKPENILFAQNYAPYNTEYLIYNKYAHISMNEKNYRYCNRDKSWSFSNYGELEKILEPIKVEVRKKIEQAKEEELDYLKIELPRKYNFEMLDQNDYYNHAGILKKFCGIDKEYMIKAGIEHGCYMGEDYYWRDDVEHDLAGVITLSDKRKNILKRHTSKNIYCVGPYIAYADYLYSLAEMNTKKENAGKTLTVFPMHSSHTTNMKYDIMQFIKKIKEVENKFDTIKVCVHWRDIVNKKYIPYQKNGYQIISAGHVYNENFLPRLKSILYCTDAVMSNDAGSYVGQAMYMNKPCYLIQQKYDNVTLNDYEEEYDLRLQDDIYMNLFKVFNNPEFKITKEQIDLCNYTWGLDQVKTKKELKDILEELENTYQKQG